MRYPFRLIFDSAKHLATHKLRGDRKFAIMLSLDPLGGCADTCGGTNGGNCEETAARPEPLSVAQCLAAMDECDTPVVAIYGGEPLEYAEIAELTRAILDRGKHLFLCTDGTLIRRRLHLIPPVTNFFWNVKLDWHGSRARCPRGQAGAICGSVGWREGCEECGIFCSSDFDGVSG